MKSKSLCLAIMAALLVFFSVGCDDSSSPGSGKKEPPSKPQSAQNQSPPVQSTQAQNTEAKAPEPEKPKNWPYITGEYKVSLAENPLARNYVLIFDGSGSMQDVDCSGGLTKIEAAKTAVMEWTTSIPPQANLGLVAFHAGGTQFTLMDIQSGPRDNIIDTIRSFQAGGKTPLTQAFQSAYGMIEKQAQSQMGYGEYTIVVVTDGAANNPETLTRVVNAILVRTPVNIYTIGFCIAGDHSLNQQGRTYYKAADNPEQLRQGLADVLAESDEFDLTEFKE